MATWRAIRLGVGSSRLRALPRHACDTCRLPRLSASSMPLLQAALLTGARYGSLGQLTASDFNFDSGTLRLRTRKGDGSERVFHVHLTDEAREFFQAACAGRRGNDLIFTRTDGRSWGKSQQQALMREASERAGISPAVNFHATRHT